MSFDTAIIIPVYNEEKVILKTVQQVLKIYPFVVCVNDGSSDKTTDEILKSKAQLVEHSMNMGQGAALQTGLDFALQYPHIKYFVTFDADGQHDINDVAKMLKVLQKRKLDVVLGSRFIGQTVDMSTTKRIILQMAIKFTNRFSGVKLTDTHNGIRVFNREFAQQLKITMPGMAHASEIIDKIGKGDWRYEEVPVTIHYTDYSKAKGQSLMNSVNIMTELLIHRTQK